MTRFGGAGRGVRAAGARRRRRGRVRRRDALSGAIERRRRRSIVHQLTALPERIDFRKEDTYAATNRVRTEGTRNLLDAALAPPGRGASSARASRSRTGCDGAAA